MKIPNLNNGQEVLTVIVQEINYHSKGILKLAASAAFFCCMAACTLQEQQSDLLKQEKAAQRLAVYLRDVMIPIDSLVQTGDLVTRRGSDITSYMMSKMNQTDTLFSHCGIVSREGDSIFVYHAIGGEFNPDQRLKREWMYSFGHPADNQAIGLFRPPFEQGDSTKLLAFVKKAYREGLMFDTKFDLETDGRQYCTEFVAKSYAMLKPAFDWHMLVKKSTIDFIPVENLYLHERMQEIKRWVY